MRTKSTMRHALLFVLSLTLPACGDEAAAPATASSTSSGAGGGGSGSGGSGGAVGCAEGLAAGNHDLTLMHGGIERTILVHVPPGYDAKSPPPLVLNFHGFTSNPGEQVIFSAMTQTSNAGGFVVGYPAGIGDSWNAGACCGTAVADDVDDVGFARAVVAEIAAKVCIDPARVYSTGMSNGGFLSHRLGCEAADLFAAIAPVAGVMVIPEQDCKPSRPVPIIHFYGTADTLVPYDGGGSFGLPSAPETNAGWVARNGCTGMPVTSFDVGAATCETHESCAGGSRVTFCSIDAMGHCWPGQPICPFGDSTADISASDEMWSFFQAFSLPR